jgi:hypothetical protein
MRNKDFSTIQVDAQLKQKIEFLTKLTGSKSQNAFLDSVISPIFSVGCYFRKAEIDSFPLIQRQNIIFQFYCTNPNKITYRKKPTVEVTKED